MWRPLETPLDRVRSHLSLSQHQTLAVQPHPWWRVRMSQASSLGWRMRCHGLRRRGAMSSISGGKLLPASRAALRNPLGFERVQCAFSLIVRARSTLQSQITLANNKGYKYEAKD